MPEYLLRIEGINFRWFIEDTLDLSTIRGGSLLYLDAWKAVAGAHKYLGRPKSQGASSASFMFEAADLKEAETRAAEVRTFLQEHNRHKHGTYSVVIHERTNQPFKSEQESLIAKARFQQLQTATVVYPDRPDVLPQSILKRTACEIDGIRPAATESDKLDSAGTRRAISASVHARRTLGREERWRFYDRVNNDWQGNRRSDAIDLADVEFVGTLDDLSDSHGREGNLDRKIAVIHIDGNKFGKLRQPCATWDDLAAFDQFLQGKRMDWLRGLLIQSLGNPRWASPQRHHQMETLLWGGDEVVLVVPAWQGWQTLHNYFKFDWGRFRDKPLTHSAGIVWCNRKAHIHRMVDLARRLTDIAKDAGAKTSSSKDLIAYQVLESFDVPGAADVSKHLPGIRAWSRMIEASGLAEVPSVAARLKRKVARSKLHGLVRCLLHPDQRVEWNENFLDPYLQEPLRELRTEIQLACGGNARSPSANDWQKVVGQTDAAWIHLHELWDYLPEEA